VEPVNVAVIYYSATGTVYGLAQAIAEGAEKAGANVRLAKAAETASQEAINARDGWAQHIEATADVPQASLDDLAWADAVVFGTPTRFGNPASQLRAFIESAAPLWFQGKLANKVYSAFSASNTNHGGQESTLLTLSNTFYHWGGIIVPPGYTDPIQFKSGTPYGTSKMVNEPANTDVIMQAARYQGSRVAEITATLKAGRAATA